MRIAPFRRVALCIALSALFCTGAALAEEPVVHAVQAPAWIERAGGIVPLRAGSALLAGDVIRTGPGGRVQVDLPEGSRVKLGEEVQFRADSFAERADAEGGFFEAAFDVLKGAFRFTTGLAGQERRRDVRFRVGTVTAGIRGTDIWGKSAEDGTDLVLLIEGQAELNVPDHAAMMMAQPLHGVMMMPSGEMQMIEGLPANMLQDYARETEMNNDRGMMMHNGDWQLVVMSLRDRALAQGIAERMVASGYPVRVDSVTLPSGEWHRIVMNHFAGSKDARMQGEALVGRFGVSGFWIQRHSNTR